MEAECGEELLVECGLAWFAHREDGFEAASAATMAAQAIPHARLAPEDGAALFPSFDPGGLAFVLHEPEAGVLRAQRAVRALARQAAAHGATFVRAQAAPEADRVRLEDGRRLEADAVVWACGPWLGRLFPDTIAIRSTRQELFFFDGGPAWRAPAVPAYVDFERAIYGTRDIDELGVKAAPDFDGPPARPRRRAAAGDRRRRGGRAGVPRRAFPGAGPRAARGIEWTRPPSTPRYGPARRRWIRSGGTSSGRERHWAGRSAGSR